MQAMQPISGVSIENNPHFKFIMDGRSSAQRWNLNQHGFAFFDHSTSLSHQDFLSPADAQESADVQKWFKFDGASAVLESSKDARWLNTYNREMAEAAKKIFPGAEAAVVTYHVLRKSDLSFNSSLVSAYSVEPRIQDSAAHQAAARATGGLAHLNFLTDEQFDALFSKLERSADEDFAREFLEAFRMSSVGNEAKKLLLEDPHYSFMAKATEAFERTMELKRLTVVPPRDPSSPVHVAASHLLKGLQGARSFYPKPLLQRLGSNLHLEGDAGAEQYISSMIKMLAQQMPQEQEAQEELASVLRDDSHYDFVARSRCLIPKPSDEEAEEDATPYQPPALGGGHCDVSAQGYLDQFRGVWGHSGELVKNQHGLDAPALGRRRRVVFVKFWRNIADTPIEDHHLAMLDKKSIQDDDIIEAELNFGGYKIMQNRLKEDIDASKLRWVYFPRMQRDEVLCFQQGDLTLHGSGEAPTIKFPDHEVDHATFHGAFADPSAPANAAPRQSIEAGVFVFLPEEPETMSRL